MKNIGSAASAAAAAVDEEVKLVVSKWPTGVREGRSGGSRKGAWPSQSVRQQQASSLAQTEDRRRRR